MKVLALGALVLALAGPSVAPAQDEPGTLPTAAAKPSLAPVSADQCGAAQMAYLIGKPRSEIPVPVDPAFRQVACVNCRLSADEVPSRLTILFDAETGIIKQVRCG